MGGGGQARSSSRRWAARASASRARGVQKGLLQLRPLVPLELGLRAGKFGGTGEMIQLHGSHVAFEELPEGRKFGRQ